MGRHVTDLSVEELEGLARKAWSGTARAALARGLAVTGSRNGRRYRYHPDGRIEDLGPVPEAAAKVAKANVEPATYKSARSSARNAKGRKRATGPN